MERFFVPQFTRDGFGATKISIIAPHADDEVFGCAGTIIKELSSGATVSVVIVTQSDDFETREAESIMASTVLGYSKPTFWGFADGKLHQNNAALVEKIVEWLDETKPDVIFAPSIWEMHRDHKACALAICDAMIKTDSSALLVMYEEGYPLHPNTIIDISGVVDKKKEAMSCFISQQARQDYIGHIEALNKYRTYSLPKDIVAAEAFWTGSKIDIERLLETEKPDLYSKALFEADIEINAIRKEARAVWAAKIESDERLRQVSNELSIVNDKLSRRSNELSIANNKLGHLSDTLNKVIYSKSWKITKPLRIIGKFIRGELTIFEILRRAVRAGYYLAPIPVTLKIRLKSVFQKSRLFLTDTASSSNNARSAQLLLTNRKVFLSSSAGNVNDLNIDKTPLLDVTIVTFNSSKWIASLIDSIRSQNYPLNKMKLIFVDNGSSDNTAILLEEQKIKYDNLFAGFYIIYSKNNGFGAGHNTAVMASDAPLVLITNPDLVFEEDSILNLVSMALNDENDTASWETRQKPYEHPKHYDPVTLECSWSSHACVLLRRKAFESVGGYDERIFLYGEDVELSYRFRSAGWKLRYCPIAVVRHYTYSEVGEVKPAQYVGSITANFYLRARYGSLVDILMIVPLFCAAMLRSPFIGARKLLMVSFFKKFLPYFASAIISKRKDKLKNISPFRGMDYELCREGAFFELGVDKIINPPIVSIVTRTMKGRAEFLKQAAYSVLNQTYSNIEWIVVEDGGDSARCLVEEFSAKHKRNIRFCGFEKLGRSAVGNAGLSMSTGKYAMFLDDDDLLYADHVETLVRALQANDHAVAAYSLAWDVASAISEDGLLIEAEYIQHTGHKREFDYELLREMNYMPIQAVLFEKRLFDERGGFDTDIDYLEDWNLWQRYAYKNSFVYAPKTTSLYRTPLDKRIQIERQIKLDEAYKKVKASTAVHIENMCLPYIPKA